MAGVQQGPNTFFLKSPAELGKAQCFAVKRGEVNDRIDPYFHKPHFRKLIKKIKAVGSKPLGLLIQYSKEVWDKSDGCFTEAFPYIEISGVGLGTNEYKVSERPLSEAPSRARQVVRTGDILVSLTRPHRGAITQVLPEHDGAIASTGFAVVRQVDSSKIDRDYLWLCLASRFGCDQMLMRSSGGSYPAITKDELSSVLIPSITLEGQRDIIAVMNAARAERKAKLAKADALLVGIDNFLFDTLNITPPPKPRNIFAIRAKDLTDVINPVRYQSWQLEKNLPFKSTVSVGGSLITRKFAPAKDAPETQFDWIRIDDLPNQPWQVETVRTERGKNINGSLFEVQENDILIARLGPTILNAKFVLCPKLARRTVASGEFLVLRCNKDYQPGAVLWILRMSLYREIMYRRSRGATPSRFRLSGDDLLSIPFPRLDKSIQSAITDEVRHRRENARRLRDEAENGWQAAKRWFEEQLLGSTSP